MADRASKLQLTDSNELTINPSTEDKQDDIIANQTNKTQMTHITDGTEEVNVTTNNELNTLDSNIMLEISNDNVPGKGHVHKFWRNPDIDTASWFEAVWNGWWDYTGQDPVVAETLETFSSAAADAGTLLSSGTATGGSATTLIDTWATFSTDTVAIWDVLINDTLVDHWIITGVTETTLTVERMRDGSTNVSGNAYRVATQASTWTPVVKLVKMLDSTWAEASEYIILNWVTWVDTIWTYIRHNRARCTWGTNIWSITTRQKTTTANITMVLPIGYNSTMIAAYTVPAGKSAQITDWFATLSKKQAWFSNVRLMFRSVNDVFQVQEELTISTSWSSHVLRTYTVPKNSIVEKTDIKIMSDTSIDNMWVAAWFDLILKDN